MLESGLASARNPESVQFWHDGENVAFRNLGVEKAIGADALLNVGRKVLRLAQSYSSDDGRRIYFQTDDFSIFLWTGGFPSFIGNPGALARLIPFGKHLFIAGNGLWLWPNSGGIALLSDAGLIRDAILIKKHILCMGDDYLIWPDIRRPTDFSGGKESTGKRLNFRDLGSNFLSIKKLGQGVGVYTKDALRPISYKGAGFWFGEGQEPIDGIGGLSPDSVVEAGFKNYGLTRNGIFVTDGASFQYIDTPAFHGYLETDLDWSRSSEIFTFHNESFQEVVFVYPAIDGSQKALAYKYTNGSFTKYRLPIFSAIPRDVHDFPIFGTASGVAYGRGTAEAECFIRTKPLDAGNSLRFKFFDYFRLVGTWAEGAIMRLGVHNQVNEEPEWIYSGPMQTATHLRRDAVFLTIEFSTDILSSFQISQIMVTGKLTGWVF